jgi:hypothetical protein
MAKDKITLSVEEKSKEDYAVTIYKGGIKK